jgi:hypothetical protein
MDDGEVLASDCTPDRRLGGRLHRRLESGSTVYGTVSDGEKLYHVTDVEDSYEMSPSGDLKSFTASLTGPDPAFEFDFHVELSPFSPSPPKGPEEIPFKTPTFWLNAGSLWTLGVAPKVGPALEAAKSTKGGRTVVLDDRRLGAEDGKKQEFGDFEKASVALHVLKLSRTGIHHLIKKQREQNSWAALVGYPMVAALMVVLALVAYRSFLRLKKGYVAPEEQDEETEGLRA